VFFNLDPDLYWKQIRIRIRIGEKNAKNITIPILKRYTKRKLKRPKDLAFLRSLDEWTNERKNGTDCLGFLKKTRSSGHQFPSLNILSG